MTGDNGNRIRAFAIGTALITAAAIFGLDRASKAWALANLQMHNSQPFIEGFLKFTLTTNTGAAFSLGSNNGGFMTVTAVVLTTALAAWLGSRIVRGQRIPIMELIGLSCIIGGSLGNLADRFLQGHVTDFLEFSFFSFPVFNVADACINLGLGLVLISRLAEDRAHKGEEAEEGKPSTMTDKEDAQPGTKEKSERQ